MSRTNLLRRLERLEAHFGLCEESDAPPLNPYSIATTQELRDLAARIRAAYEHYLATGEPLPGDLEAPLWPEYIASLKMAVAAEDACSAPQAPEPEAAPVEPDPTPEPVPTPEPEPEPAPEPVRIPCAPPALRALFGQVTP